MSNTRTPILACNLCVHERVHVAYIYVCACVYRARENTRPLSLPVPYKRTVGLSSSLDTQQVREPAFASSFHCHSSLRTSSCAHDCFIHLPWHLSSTNVPSPLFARVRPILVALNLLFLPLRLRTSFFRLTAV